MSGRQFQVGAHLRLPLPLAQLYKRAHNGKDPRSQHDNAYYFFEVLIKLMSCTLLTSYIGDSQRGESQSQAVDREIANLRRASIGHWVAMLRVLARHFGQGAGAASHPLGHLWEQLNEKHRSISGLTRLYQRIKNRVDGSPANDRTCTITQLFDALPHYRTDTIGHAASRSEAFYADDLGPLLYDAMSELVAPDMLHPIGPAGSRLVFVTDLRGVGQERYEMGLRELVGSESTRAAPLILDSDQAKQFDPQRVAVLWPGHATPMRLDPLVIFRERELGEEILFANAYRGARRAEYLGYSTGRIEVDTELGEAMGSLLDVVAPRGDKRDDEEPAAATSAAPPTDPARQIVGEYELLAEVGKGGMGVVYLARQLTLDRVVALKMLSPDLIGDEIALARFRREMRALGRCDHRNIIKLLDSGQLPTNQLFYTMEYVPGCDLEQVWRELSQPDSQRESAVTGERSFSRAVLSASGKKRRDVERRYSSNVAGGTDEQALAEVPPLPLPPLPNLPAADADPRSYVRCVARLMRDAAAALQVVHDHDLVHRDVSPGNLMLTPTGEHIVLMDFGLAKGRNVSQAVSVPGGFLGTLRYAAPEQLASAMLTVGPQADVRGLGAVMWELLARRRLFGDARDEAQLSQYVLHRDVPRLREINADFDADLDAIVARATERNTDDRIQSAERLAEYLDLYLDGKPLPIRPPTTAEMVRRWVREHRPLVRSAAVAALVVIASVITAFVLVNDARKDAEALAASNEQLAVEAQRLAGAQAKLARDNKQLAQSQARLTQQEKEARIDAQRSLYRFFKEKYERARGNFEHDSAAIWLAAAVELGRETGVPTQNDELALIYESSFVSKFHWRSPNGYSFQQMAQSAPEAPLWAVDLDGQVYKADPDEKSWTFKPVLAGLGKCEQARVSPDASYMAGVFNQRVYLIRLDDGQSVQVYPSQADSHRGRMKEAIQVSRDGAALYCVENDHVLKLSVPEGKVVKRWKLPYGDEVEVLSMYVDEDRSRAVMAATINGQRRLVVCDLSNAQELLSVERQASPYTSGHSLSVRGGKAVYVGAGPPSIVYCIDFADTPTVWKRMAPWHGVGVDSMSDEGFGIVYGDGGVGHWSYQGELTERQTVPGVQAKAGRPFHLPSGTWVCADGRIVWRDPSGRAVSRESDPVESARSLRRLASDRVLSVTDRGAVVRRIEDGAVILRLDHPSLPGAADVAMDADGRWVHDHRIRRPGPRRLHLRPHRRRDAVPLQHPRRPDRVPHAEQGRYRGRPVDRHAHRLRCAWPPDLLDRSVHRRRHDQHHRLIHGVR